MSGHVIQGAGAQAISGAAELKDTMARADFSSYRVLLAGFGHMGLQYWKALKALGVRDILVCSRSPEPLKVLAAEAGTRLVAGGFRKLDKMEMPPDLAIVATPTADLADACEHLAGIGCRRILIEKPIALYSRHINELAGRLRNMGTEAFCAYNRASYPGLIEVRRRAFEEGGITSCFYTFTELVHRVEAGGFSAEELRRWGVANSLHVMSMAHALIGWPLRWNCHREGSLSWHPSGSIFMGWGSSDGGVPFSYHSDWGSAGRWSVEVYTRKAGYRFCPLEKVYFKESSLEEWRELPVEIFSTETKTGFAEQLASALEPSVRRHVPLVSIEEAARLTQFGEEIFGYR